MPAPVEAKIRKAQRDLDLKDVDYEGTMAAKLRIARELFNLQGHRDLQVGCCVPWCVGHKFGEMGDWGKRHCHVQMDFKFSSPPACQERWGLYHLGTEALRQR